MNIRVWVAQTYLPSFYRRRKLCQLFDLTARAFNTSTPDLTDDPFPAILRKYALFTQSRVLQAISDKKDLASLKKSLYQQAYHFGQEIRKKLGIRNAVDEIRALKLIYQIIGIDIQADLQGNITIPTCFFSKFYNCQTCEIISGLDEGVAAGVSQGKILHFSQRITEGNAFCKATLKKTK